MVRINPSLVGLIDPSVERLMQDLQSLKRHVYQFDSENQRIGYRKHDGISYNTLYSYRTLFVLMHELEKAGFDINTNVKVQDKMRLILYCGQFSYTAVQQQFTCTLGVFPRQKRKH